MLCTKGKVLHLLSKVRFRGAQYCASASGRCGEFQHSYSLPVKPGLAPISVALKGRRSEWIVPRLFCSQTQTWFISMADNRFSVDYAKRVVSVKSFFTYTELYLYVAFRLAARSVKEKLKRVKLELPRSLKMLSLMTAI